MIVIVNETFEDERFSYTAFIDTKKLPAGSPYLAAIRSALYRQPPQ